MIDQLSELDLQDAVTILTSVVTVASVVVATTETKKDDTVLGKLYKLIEILALVVGKAKDKGK